MAAELLTLSADGRLSAPLNVYHLPGRVVVVVVVRKAAADAGAEINYSRGCQRLPVDHCMEPGVTNCFHNSGPCESDL